MLDKFAGFSVPLGSVTFSPSRFSDVDWLLGESLVGQPGDFLPIIAGKVLHSKFDPMPLALLATLNFDYRAEVTILWRCCDTEAR